MAKENEAEELEGFSAYWDESDDRTVLRIKGDLDLSASGALRAFLMDEVGLAGPQIVIDLAEVPFVDSTCLGVLIAAARRARQSERRLVLARAQRRVERAFEIAGLSEVLPLVATIDAADGRAGDGDR